MLIPHCMRSETLAFNTRANTVSPPLIALRTARARLRAIDIAGTIRIIAVNQPVTVVVYAVGTPRLAGALVRKTRIALCTIFTRLALDAAVVGAAGTPLTKYGASQINGADAAVTIEVEADAHAYQRCARTWRTWIGPATQQVGQLPRVDLLVEA